MKSHLVKITTLGLIAAALTIIPVTSRAQDASNPSAATAPKKHAGLFFHGKVTDVDAIAETLTVGKRIFSVTSATKIVRGKKGATVKFSDIKIGEIVGGSYKKEANGSLSVQTLHIGLKATKTKKKKATVTDSSTNSIPN